jgi:hypothetical protein
MPRVLDAGQDRVELRLGDQERVVLCVERRVYLGHVNRHVVVQVMDQRAAMGEVDGHRQADDVREELCRCVLVSCG